MSLPVGGLMRFIPCENSEADYADVNPLIGMKAAVKRYVSVCVCERKSVCVCVYVCLCVGECVRVRMYVCMYVCMYACMYVCVGVLVLVCCCIILYPIPFFFLSR